jgi:hypothetical protein
VKNLYLRDPLLIDMNADEQARRETDSVRTDQIGKVFIVVGQDVRKCLICEQLFTRRSLHWRTHFPQLARCSQRDASRLRIVYWSLSGHSPSKASPRISPVAVVKLTNEPQVTQVL